MKYWSQKIWDAWCAISIIGIWPRFIEPKLLSVTKLDLGIPHLPRQFDGFKILQFSDLHWNGNFSKTFVDKCICKLNKLEPEIVVFTGDFICRSKLENPEGLKQFLCSLKAKVGHFAILGNHDYEQFATVNDAGDYDIESCSKPSSNIVKGFKRLLSSITLTKKVTPAAKKVKFHSELIKILNDTPFQLLHNASCLLPYKDSHINVCGLGEYILGRFNPEEAFEKYNKKFPGLVLTHNPDTFSSLMNYPGDLILAGHTHGGQINLPWFWKQFTYMENVQWKRGLKKLRNKWAYISRGVGSSMPFRWFSMPELTLFTLRCG